MRPYRSQIMVQITFSEGAPAPCLLPEIITDSHEEDFLKAA